MDNFLFHIDVTGGKNVTSALFTMAKYSQIVSATARMDMKKGKGGKGNFIPRASEQFRLFAYKKKSRGAFLNGVVSAAKVKAWYAELLMG